MVKGVSKQVIVVHSQDKQLFDQAIFILSDEVVHNKAVTDEMLLREAKHLLSRPEKQEGNKSRLLPIAYAILGASLTGGIWALTAFL